MAIIHLNGRQRGYHYLSMVVFLVLLLWMLCSANPLLGAQQSDPKKILLLASCQPSAPVGYLWNRGIQSILESGGSSNVDLDIEYLDVLQFKDAPYVQLQINLLRHKYTASQPDLVITVYNMAFDFMRTHGPDLFPGVPVVFAGVEKKFIDTRYLGPNITGVISVPNYAETLDLALRLHPDTQHVAVVSGAGKIGSTWSMNAMQAFQPYGDRFDFIDITGRPMPAILDKVANLPQRSLVMYITLLEDGAGNKFTATESASQISRVANAPVYSFWDLMLGHGIVGGYLSSAEEKGKAAAALALRILNGEQPSDIPLSIEGSLNAMFDWRELNAWSISEDKLPPGSLVKYKERGVWDKYRGRILGGIALIVLQALIISFLLFQRKIRLRAEQTLEERLVFEELLSELSSDFTRGFAEKTDLKIIDGLSQVGTFMNADRCYLFRFNWNRSEFRNTHMWQAKGILADSSTRDVIIKDLFPWLASTLLHGKDVIVDDVNALSGEISRNEYEYCKQIGIRSFVVIPIQVENAPLCSIGLDTIRTQRKWSKKDRDRIGLVGEIFANAVERKHSEERLMAAESRYRTVADFTYDWEYWSNTDGFLEYISPSCERISGYNAREFKEQPTLFREIILPEDQQIWDKHAADSEENYKPGEIQFRIKRKDKEIRWIEHMCQPVTDPQGVLLGFRASNRDITKRKHYRSETDKLQTELAHMDRVVTISTLTSALAHEINQPLAAMRSYAQAALRFMDRDQPQYDSVRKALQGIVADNKRAADVVNRLRALVKKGSVQREMIDINALIKDVIGLVNSELVLRDTAVSLGLDPNVPIVKGDPVQIQQVMINLLTNALDAMEGQTKKARTLIVSTRLENINKIIVSISDSGEGIVHGNFETIFSPFHTTKSTGMGLGLSICKTIIEAHGGRIFAENNPDGGALFSFSLTANDTE